MANLVYRKSTTPGANGATVNKGTPLTNDELDGNFIGIQAELNTKAPFASPTFTGTVTIPTVDINAGAIDGVVIGGSSAAAGSFTTLSATGTVTGPSGSWSATGIDLAVNDAYSINGVSILTSASLTNAIHYGNTTAAGSLALRGSSNASPSGHSVTLGGSNSGASNSGTTTIQGATVNILVGAAASAGFLKVAATTGLVSVDTTTYLTSATGVSTLSFGTTGLTPNSGTSGAITVAGTLIAANGGTGHSTFTIGDILYASTSSVLSKLPAGANGYVLLSQGPGVAPVWSTPDGLSAGSSELAANISLGTAGDLLYQSASNVTAKLAIGASSRVLTSTGSAPQWSTQDSLTVGNATLATHVSLGTAGDLLYQSASNVTAKLAIGSANRVLTSSGSAPQWSTSVTLSGTLTHAGLTPSAGTAVDQLYTASDAAFVVDNTWKDTAVNANELASGSYIVQVTTGTEIYTGYMSWYGSDTNSTISDEVALHRASVGTEESGSPLFLKTLRTVTGDAADMKLQITSTITRSSATYTYKFRRMI